jgi:hypothetical protein
VQGVALNTPDSLEAVSISGPGFLCLSKARFIKSPNLNGEKTDAQLCGEIELCGYCFQTQAIRINLIAATNPLLDKNMNGYLASHLQFLARAWRQLAIVLLAGTAFGLCGFPETILANDGTQTSKELHARITRAQAEKAALTKVPGGKVKAAKLSQENGQVIWSVDVITPLTKKVAAIQVDAQSGKVLSKLVQGPGDRAEDTATSEKK